MLSPVAGLVFLLFTLFNYFKGLLFVLSNTTKIKTFISITKKNTLFLLKIRML